MSTQHNVITDPNIHEPKGASTAAIDTAYVSNGAGSGTWKKLTNTTLDGITATAAAGYFLVADGAGGFKFVPAAHGSVYFSNFTTPYAFSATTTYAKVAPTSTGSGHATAITEDTTTKLIYTGTQPVTLDVVFQATIDQSTGSNKDIYVCVYKNGVLVPGSELATTTVSGQKKSVSLHVDSLVSTNDYYEIYCKIDAAATVNFYGVNLFISTAGA